MDDCIITYLQEYANDLETRLQVGSDVNKLPVTLAVSTLLNPMFGLEPLIVGSGLMSSTQYNNARKSLLHMMQDYLDAKQPYEALGESDSSEDSRDGYLSNSENVNFSKAKAELAAFEKFKRVKYHPKFGGPDDTVDTLLTESEDDKGNNVKREIVVGPEVVARGEDLPSKKNHADYIDSNGRFDVLSFFDDHQRLFPTLFIMAQRMASRRVVEVGCERFFSLSGYISCPRRTRLGVRTYERLAMLASNLNCVYVDPEMAATQNTFVVVRRDYGRRSLLRRLSKAGIWSG